MKGAYLKHLVGATWAAKGNKPLWQSRAVLYLQAPSEHQGAAGCVHQACHNQPRVSKASSDLLVWCLTGLEIEISILFPATRIFFKLWKYM